MPCSITPEDVEGLTSGVMAVAAGGGGHTCLLTVGGGVKCWGPNLDGQLGDGTNTRSATPVEVVGLSSGVAAISVGTVHTCAVTSAGGVKCWGWNGAGELGDGQACGNSCTTPVDVCADAECASNLSGVAAVAAGRYHTCALSSAGGVKCWGYAGDDRNALGAETTELCVGFTGELDLPCSTTPVDVSGLTSGVAALSAGAGHTCALTTEGSVKCWGLNGLLGCATTCDDALPVQDVVGLGSGAAAVSAGDGGTTCAVTVEGGLKCWGLGSLGDGTTTARTTPVDVLLALKTEPGDANCDGTINSIDAAIVLQFSAGLLGSLPCTEGGDVNGDGDVTSVDAALILQFTAGLLESPPP